MLCQAHPPYQAWLQKQKLCSNLGINIYIALFCESWDWVISVSHPILIFDRNFSRNIDSWQSVLLVKKDIFGGAERGERWFMSQDLPSLIFTSYFILLVFCIYLSHFIFYFTRSTPSSLSLTSIWNSTFFMLYLDFMFSILCHMIHTSHIFTSYYPGTIPLLQFLWRFGSGGWKFVNP